MSVRRREELVRLARQYDALVVTDDVYDFLQWSTNSDDGEKFCGGRACAPRIVDVDRYLEGGDEWGNAISNGSFSKLIGPGTRTGWAEASEKLAYGLSQTYGVPFGTSSSMILVPGPEFTKLTGYRWQRLFPIRRRSLSAMCCYYRPDVPHELYTESYPRRSPTEIRRALPHAAIRNQRASHPAGRHSPSIVNHSWRLLYVDWSPSTPGCHGSS
jgi:hypothetical protein